MTLPHQISEVLPNPADVVSLVEGLVRDPWPATNIARDALFERLRLTTVHQLSGHDKDGPTLHYVLATNLRRGSVFGTWQEKSGALESVNLQLRVAMAPPDPKATQCFDAIRSRLTELHGKSSIPWHGQKGMRRMWNTNGIDIDMHYANESRSSLMIGVSDARMFAAVEAYAREN